MVYITVRQNMREKQVSWEDVLFDEVTENDFAQCNSPWTGTITRRVEKVDEKYLRKINVDGMIRKLEKFNEENADLFVKDRMSLYRHFKIPKKTGGLRQIDAPKDELQSQLSRLSRMLTDDFGLLYHTAAFAYVKGRSIVDCVSKHKKNESKWYLKTDFSGFFPNTTLDYTMKMMSMIFPMSEVCKSEKGYNALKTALSLGFLNGGLPQGTTLSPALTNIISIPMDHALFNALAKKNIVYTRYADDMHISAVNKFPYKDVVNLIRETLKEFGAPYELKDEKTHFGSRAGRNWNLGLMVNKDNNITVGYRNKKYFKAAMTNLILDTKNGKLWDVGDVMHLRGQLSFYEMVEPEYFKGTLKRLGEKWNVNTTDIFNQYLS